MIPLPSALAGAMPLFGDGGREWLRRLPDLVRSACDRWDIEVGPPYEPGGVCSWVAPATRPDGRRVVLKITVPHDEAAAEVAGLRSFDGVGAVRLLDADPPTWTLLLEELGPSLRTESKERRLDALIDVARRLWRAVPRGIPPMAEIVGDWPDATRTGPIAAHWDTELVRRAGTVLGRLVADPVEPVLLHGDLHDGNVLARAGSWAAIDPKPMLGDPAFDLRQVIRCVAGPDPRATLEAAREAEAATGVPAERALAWSYALGMTSAVWVLDTDPRQADEFHAAATAAATWL